MSFLNNTLNAKESAGMIFMSALSVLGSVAFASYVGTWAILAGSVALFFVWTCGLSFAASSTTSANYEDEGVLLFIVFLYGLWGVWVVIDPVMAVAIFGVTALVGTVKMNRAFWKKQEDASKEA